MQIKKEAVRLEILKAAKSEFYKKGFFNASMRTIADLAGTKMSNFYNYFDNKEDIFCCLTKKTYENFNQIFKTAMHYDAFSRSPDANITVEIHNFLMLFAPLINDEMYMLINCSEGTKYAATKTELIIYLVKIINIIMAKYGICEFSFPIEIFIEISLNNILSVSKKFRSDPRLQDFILYLATGTIVGFITMAKFNNTRAAII